jgi:ribose transport system permease protein
LDHPRIDGLGGKTRLLVDEEHRAGGALKAVGLRELEDTDAAENGAARDGERAVAGNGEAARLSGVPVKRVLLFAYIASGLLAGLGGVIMASQLKSGSATYGNMYELYVIAAVVVGGTSLSGGEGRMLGTLTGAFTIAVIQNGMNLTNVESYTQKVVLGLVILGAVLLDRLRHAR